MDIDNDHAAWRKLLAEAADAASMTTTLYDVQGTVLLHSGDPPNALCKMVQGHGSAVTTICSVAQQEICREAHDSQEPAIGECDLGMVKLVVPIIRGGEILGFVSACGAREPDVEVETDLAAQTLDVPEDTLTKPAASVGRVTPQSIRRTVARIRNAIEHLDAALPHG